LLEWHRTHSRSFSFRKATDPYGVLVAEIMLRQTTARQVDRVWPMFMKRFPTPKSLAEADISEVERIITPLGIRSRAQHLKRMAQMIVSQWRGNVPADLAELTKLPGVGEYIAGCVLSFCYGMRLPLIDSNVMRVLSRVLGIKPSKHSQRHVQQVLRQAYMELASRAEPRQLHYALLDLAATLCRPNRTLCHECPLHRICAYASSLTGE